MEAQNREHEDDSVKRRTALFNQYVVPHINLIYKLCIRYSYSSADVQDNYNEVLINFFKYIETYNPAKSIQTWLHIVTKRFIHELNKRNSLFSRTDDVKVADIADTLPTEMELNSDSSEVGDYQLLYSDDVVKALECIKPIYRDALLLQLAGYRLDEIVDITYANGTLQSKNIETVKSRLHLAKKQLRKLINRHGERQEA